MRWVLSRHDVTDRLGSRGPRRASGSARRSPVVSRQRGRRRRRRAVPGAVARGRPRRRAHPARGAAGHRGHPRVDRAGLDRRQRRRHAHGDDPARRQAAGRRTRSDASPRASAAGSPARRSGWCWASCPARCSASSSSSTGRAGSCCSSRRTWWPSSGSSRSTRTTSGSGSACTRSPTGCSSPRCRGCAQHMLDEVAALTDAIDTDPTSMRERLSRRRRRTGQGRARAGRRAGSDRRAGHARAARSSSTG